MQQLNAKTTKIRSVYLAEAMGYDIQPVRPEPFVISDCSDVEEDQQGDDMDVCQSGILNAVL